MASYQRFLSEGNTGDAPNVVKRSLGDIGRYERMHQELDETSKMMAELTESFSKVSKASVVIGERDRVMGDSTTLEERQSIKMKIDTSHPSNKMALLATLSTSEPGGCL